MLLFTRGGSPHFVAKRLHLTVMDTDKGSARRREQITDQLFHRFWHLLFTILLAPFRSQDQREVHQFSGGSAPFLLHPSLFCMKWCLTTVSVLSDSIAISPVVSDITVPPGMPLTHRLT